MILLSSIFFPSSLTSIDWESCDDGQRQMTTLCQEKPNFSRPTTPQARTQQPRVLSCSDVYLISEGFAGKKLSKDDYEVIGRHDACAKGRIPDVIWTLQTAIHEAHRRSELSINSWSVLISLAFLVWDPVDLHAFCYLRMVL